MVHGNFQWPKSYWAAINTFSDKYPDCKNTLIPSVQKWHQAKSSAHMAINVLIQENRISNILQILLQDLFFHSFTSDTNMCCLGTTIKK